MAPKGYRSVNVRDDDFKRLGHIAVEEDMPKIDMLRKMIKYYLDHHPEG